MGEKKDKSVKKSNENNSLKDASIKDINVKWEELSSILSRYLVNKITQTNHPRKLYNKIRFVSNPFSCQKLTNLIII